MAEKKPFQNNRRGKPGEKRENRGRGPQKGRSPEKGRGAKRAAPAYKEKREVKAPQEKPVLDSRLEIALHILIDIEKNGKYINLAFKNEPQIDRLEKKDRAYIMRILYGVVEKGITLEWLLQKVLKDKRVKPWLLAILKMGTYQIYYMRIEDEDAIRYAAELCKKYVSPELEKFVAAVLTRLSKNKDEYNPEYYKFATTQERLSVLYSYPEWIIRMWMEEYGIETANALLKEQERRSINLRLCTEDKAAIRQSLEQQGVLCQDGVFSNTLSVTDTVNVEQLDCYRDGLVTVQGIGSMLTVQAMQIRKNSYVLDACAAPGGKSFYICEKTKNQVKSWDIHEHRVELIRKGAERLKLQNIEPECRDSSVPCPELENSFDRVLLDVPCSGLGMIHSKPDIKNRIQESEIEELAKVQAGILETCSAYVKPGGLLTYSTCTVSKRENEGNVRAFLQRHPESELAEIRKEIPEMLNYVVNEETVMILPSQFNVDAFFIAVMRKKD